jgi:flavin-dependent dehydrogenase
MKSRKKKTRILIIGGGVAGASLAIRLANENLRVTVIEKDRLPRHKLCGEFVSPECLPHFKALSVLDSIRQIGGDPIRETRFFSPSGKSIKVPSKWFSGGKHGALGISRSEMDLRLIVKARNSGARIFEESRACGINIEKNRLAGVTVKNKYNETVNIKAELVIDATGRSRVIGKLLDRKMGTKPRKNRTRHIAFKAHFENVGIDTGVCEIYFFRGGYGGLSFVENGIANNCFLVESRVAREFDGNADRVLKELIFKNTRAGAVMKNAVRKFDWLAVSIEKFGKQRLNDIDNLISVGDAGAFIDPFTGSGMLMALESSELLSKVILSNPGQLASNKTGVLKAEYEKSHAKTTRRRLRICSLLRNISQRPRLAELAISTANISDRLLSTFASMTRPS